MKSIVNELPYYEELCPLCDLWWTYDGINAIDFRPTSIVNEKENVVYLDFNINIE